MTFRKTLMQWLNFASRCIRLRSHPQSHKQSLCPTCLVPSIPRARCRPIPSHPTHDRNHGQLPYPLDFPKRANGLLPPRLRQLPYDAPGHNPGRTRHGRPPRVHLRHHRRRPRPRPNAPPPQLQLPLRHPVRLRHARHGRRREVVGHATHH